MRTIGESRSADAAQTGIAFVLLNHTGFHVDIDFVIAVMSFLGFAVHRLIGIGFFIQQVFNQEAGLSFFLISAKTDLKSSPFAPQASSYRIAFADRK